MAMHVMKYRPLQLLILVLLAMPLAACNSKGTAKGSDSDHASAAGHAHPTIWVVMDSIEAGLGPAKMEQDVLGVASPSYKVVERVDCGDNPRDPVVAAGSVWVSNNGDDTLTRVDPGKEKAVATIKAPYGAEGFALRKTTAWVADDHNGVTRLDLTSGKAVAEIPTDIGPRRVAVAGGAVWVTHVSFSVVRVDAATNKKVATIVTKVDGMPAIPLDVAATKSAVWVTTNKGAIIKIDPSTNHVAAIIKRLAGVSDIGVAMGGVARVVAGEGGVWAVLQKAGSIARIDPTSNRVVARIKVAAPIWDIAIGQGAVWVLHGKQGLLAKIDPSSNHATDVAHFGAAARALTIGAPGS
jgi:streptogramin lyase